MIGEKNFKTISSYYQKEKEEEEYIATGKQKQNAMKKKYSENMEESSKTLKNTIGKMKTLIGR